MNSIDELQKALKQYIESLKQTRSSRRTRKFAVDFLYRGLKEYIRKSELHPIYLTPFLVLFLVGMILPARQILASRAESKHN